MTMGGLAAAVKLYEDYGVRAKELSAGGKKIIGYMCALTPVEIIEAAGFVPLRIKGDVNEPITRADTQMETIICPVVRSCYDVMLKGNYSFLSGLVIPHACDSIVRTYDIWKFTTGLPYAHLINMPHETDASSLAFYKEVLQTFKTSLGKYAGKEVTDADLARMVQAYNDNRAKIRELYEFRKVSPPLISGTEITKVLVACMSLPVAESTALLEDVINEVKKRPVTGKPGARIMVVGADIDDASFINLIEESGAAVVTDDLCPGTRDSWEGTEVTTDPMDGVAERYLKKVKCGRTYRETTGSYTDDLEDRFGHIKRFVRDFSVNGVILYIYKYCDSFGFEVPAMKDYIKSLSMPVLYLEDEYSQTTIARLKTRVQAFLEMLG